MKLDWEKVFELCRSLWDSGKGDFIGAVIFVISTVIITYLFWKPLQGIIRQFSFFRQQMIIIPKALEKYKNTLEQETIRIAHSWKLEGQSLKDIFVQLSVHYANEPGKRVPLNEVLFNHFENKNINNPHPKRLILIGDAGSGKSVGMGYIARTIWKVPRKNLLVPILLTFSDAKQVKNENDLETILIKSLEKYQFENGKKGKRAEQFVKENLYAGNILIILDGLDELEKGIRFEVCKFFKAFFQTYPGIPFVISSRKAVWQQNPSIFDGLQYQLLEVANFTPNDIKVFTKHWQFSGPKSGEKLAELINSKTYLRNIAVNPLMLTIISFLYAQPKRILPDNRVKFYSECIDALLEQWDNTKMIDRANEFETVDKRTVLSELAYRHITNSSLSDGEIAKTMVLDTFTEVMQKLSRPIEKREKLLNEIVQNAELLVSVPPEGYVFPHRTFMEFFAANHFFEEHQGEQLLNLYLSDQGRWEETLLLFCGLNTNQNVADLIQNRLLTEFLNTMDSTNPNRLVFRALLESTRVNPKVADQILSAAAVYLNKNLDIEVVENLGFLAMNSSWEHSKAAKNILLDILDRPGSTNDTQTILLAAVILQDEEIKNRALSYVDKINLTEFLIRLGDDSEEFAIKLLQNIKPESYSAIFEGLRAAGKTRFLINFAIKSQSIIAKGEAALALFKPSPDSFEEFNNIDLTGTGIDPKGHLFDDLFYKLRWWRIPELNENGQRVVWLLCHCLQDWGIKNHKAFVSMKNLDKRIGFLLSIIFLKHHKQKIDHWDFGIVYSNLTGKIALWNFEGFIESGVAYAIVCIPNVILYFYTIISYFSFPVLALYILSCIPIAVLFIIEEIEGDRKISIQKTVLAGILLSLVFQPIFLMMGGSYLVLQVIKPSNSKYSVYNRKRELYFSFISSVFIILFFISIGSLQLWLIFAFISLITFFVHATIIEGALFPFVISNDFHKYLNAKD